MSEKVWMWNLCLGIHNFSFFHPVFFSSFKGLCGCFEKLMNHGPLNTSDQTGPFNLRESCVARTHVFGIRSEIQNPGIFSSANVQINIPLYISQWWGECLRRHRGEFYHGRKINSLGRTYVQIKGISCHLLPTPYLLVQEAGCVLAVGGFGWPNFLLTKVVGLVLPNPLLS